MEKQLRIPKLNCLHGTDNTVEIRDTDVFDYLLQTRTGITELGAQVSEVLHPADMTAMYDYAVEHWNKPTRNKALEILCDTEQKLIAEHKLNLHGESDEGLFTTLYGAFAWDEDLLFGLGQPEEHSDYEYRYFINGLGNSDRKKRKKDSKDKKEKIVSDKKLLHQINAANPLAVIARNAFRALVAVNLFGMATVLSAKDEKSKRIRENTANRYFNAGGRKEVMLESINKGATKKILLNKKLKDDFDKSKNAKNELKLEGLGAEPATTTALIASAAAIMVPVVKEIADAGIKIQETKQAVEKTKQEKAKTQEIQTIQDNSTPLPTADSDKAGVPEMMYEQSYAAGSNDPSEETVDEKKKKQKRLAVIGGSLTVAAVLGYFGFKRLKKT